MTAGGDARRQEGTGQVQAQLQAPGGAGGGLQAWGWAWVGVRKGGGHTTLRLSFAATQGPVDRVPVLSNIRSRRDPQNLAKGEPRQHRGPSGTVGLDSLLQKGKSSGLPWWSSG